MQDRDDTLGQDVGCAVDQQEPSTPFSRLSINFVPMRRVDKKPASEWRRGGLIHFVDGNQKPLPAKPLFNLFDRFGASH